MLQGPQLRWDQRLSVFLLLVMIIVMPVVPDEVKSAPPRQQIALLQPAAVPQLITSPQVSPSASSIPTFATVDSTALLNQLAASTVYVSDEASGAILLADNADQPVYPASSTKIMTALVAREVYYLSQVLTVKEEAFAQGNTMGLQPGEQISVNQLLHGLLISSGNDAAFVLANNHPQGYEGFVQAMNQKAHQLGLKNTTFANPSGLDADNHLMTAHDLAILSREIFKDEVLSTIMATKTLTATDASGQIPHLLGHTHELLYTDPTVVGGKTGTTEFAQQVLVTKFRRPDITGQNRDILVVVMGSQDRYGDTRTIIDWVMANYTWKELSW
jgi:D-alanyl-D-alanine carboxypeptidase (penicillin-binding protein 5/6)